MSRILCLSHIFPPAVDGGSRVIYKIGQYFQSCNDEVLYLSSDCSSTDDFTKTKYLRSEKLTSDQLKLLVYHSLRRPLKLLEVICTKFLFINHNSYILNLIKIFQKGPIFKITPFVKATIQILKFKPDLIIAGPLPTTIILYANFLKFLTNKLNNYSTKLLVNASFHPTDPDFHRLPLIKTLQSADYLWTLTQSETDYFINNFKINPDKIILAGNGVDESFLLKKTKSEKLRSDKLTILYIGSLSAHKGLDVLINSFSLLMSSNPEHQSTSKLIVSGQKTLYYPQIKKQINKLPKNIRSQIKFIFSFSQNKLAKIIDDCDILVLPSKQESFGLVLIEAWARQKPVIVSNIPSLSEIVTNSQGGLIFNVNDPNDLQQKITQLIQNPKLYHQLRQNGFNYVKNNYTWSIVGRKIQKKLSL